MSVATKYQIVFVLACETKIVMAKYNQVKLPGGGVLSSPGLQRIESQDWKCECAHTANTIKQVLMIVDIGKWFNHLG